MCICSQPVCSADVVTSWRHNALLGQMHVLQLAVERKKLTSAQSRYVKGTEEEFLFATKKRVFSGMHELRFVL